MSRSKRRRRGGAFGRETGEAGPEDQDEVNAAVPRRRRRGEADLAEGRRGDDDPWYPGRPDRLRRDRIV